MERRFLPAAGIGLALISGLALAVAGVDLWLVAALVLVWIGSFWLAVPPPAAPPADTGDGLRISQSGMSDLIERSSLPMILLDGERIVVANDMARETIGRHIVGQDARVAFRHPAAVDLLARREPGIITVQGLTGPKSNWTMGYQPIDKRFSLVELVDRTAEQDVSRAHTDFVANASHELRTPLASIIGYVETLEDEGEDVDPKQAQHFYGIVLREARRLQALVQDLMSLSRVEAEKHDIPSEQIDFALLVRQAAHEGAGADRAARLDLDMADTGITVRGDARQLEQLVRNLVDNALKYGDAEKPVTVSLQGGERKMAVLKVVDRGDGIASEHVPHLTRRFYRTDPGRSRAGGGTGLGLAIVKHIVERHRGRLDIGSNRGEGTTVTVTLPMVSNENNGLSERNA